MARKSEPLDGCLGCLALFIVLPVGYSFWQSMGGWVSLPVSIGLLALFGLIQQKLSEAIKFQEFKKKEKERIQNSVLRQRARNEAVKELGLYDKANACKSRSTFPGHIMHLVFERDGGKCVICGSLENLQFDHIVPFSKGGADTVENLRLLCSTCNQRRGNRFL